MVSFGRLVYDTIFATPLDKTARFSFDEKVAACFPDMIRRSVPGYGQMLAMLPILARRHCLKRQSEGDRYFSRVYDLGTSLGAVTLALAAEFAPDELSICALDISKPMLDKAKILANNHYPTHNVEFICADITDFPLLPCDLIVLNLTLQFLPPQARLGLLQKCHEALAEGGLLIITEKTHHTDDALDAWFVGHYHTFKRKNGYSELEISAKRDALENVLVTDTLEQHKKRLAQVGFCQVVPWFMFLNFVSLAAFK